MHLPMPGTWQKGRKHSFAVLTTEAEDPRKVLSTSIWPTFRRTKAALSSEVAFAIPDKPKGFSAPSFKPSPGRIFRPAFADHDGNGLTDIAWLTWEGGYKTARLKPSSEQKSFSPWALHYPRSRQAPGLYVVERNAHRIGLYPAEKNGILNGTNKNQPYRIISGNPQQKPEEILDEPDPIARGKDGLKLVPRTSKQNSCPACYPGGDYSGDGGPAKKARLNSPRDVTSAAKGALYIADYGNGRIRKISPGRDDLVNGSNDETISSIAGGSVARGISCPALRDGVSAGPSSGLTSALWSDYHLAAQKRGIHPTCVSLRPLTVEIDAGTGILFVGDESGVIFMIRPGQDKATGSADDRMYALAEKRPDWSIPTSSSEGAKFFPSEIALVKDRENKQHLLIASRASGIPSDQISEPTGGILVLSPKNGDFGREYPEPAPSIELRTLLGTWKSSNSPPGNYGDSRLSPQADIRNPVALAAYSATSHNEKKTTPGVFVSGWWQDSKNNSFENSLIHVYAKDQKSSRKSNSLIPRATLRWINNPHSNSWGKRPPKSPAEIFDVDWKSQTPLSTLPVEPGPGLALSPDNRYLYFSQPRLGSVMIVELDQDSDGRQDLDNPLTKGARDEDSDGDGTENTKDYFPLQAQSDKKRDFLRLLETSKDPKMWAVSPNGKMDAAGVLVDRLEWWLDRFSALDNVPWSKTLPITPEEEPLATLLNRDTIAIANPGATLHSNPIWPGGISRRSEVNSQTGLPRLTPILLGASAPRESQIKTLSGYDQCADWTFDENKESSLSKNGEPVSTCGRNLHIPLYADGRTVGIRRATLAHWKGQWPTFARNTNSPGELIFIDWDGDSTRDPALFPKTNTKSRTPGGQLMVHIGNLKERIDQGVNPCPGDFALSELRDLNSILAKRLTGKRSSLSTQYHCGSARFFSKKALAYVSISLDHHAEWRTGQKIETKSFPKQTSSRLVTNKRQKAIDQGQ